MTKSTKSTHGGARPGSGPKRKLDNAEPISVRLSRDQAEYARTVGAGEVSAGIRRIIEEHKAAT